jgi:hypothetical protein
MMNETVANSSATLSNPIAGAIDTDVQLYLPNGMAALGGRVR